VVGKKAGSKRCVMGRWKGASSRRIREKARLGRFVLPGAGAERIRSPHPAGGNFHGGTGAAGGAFSGGPSSFPFDRLVRGNPPRPQWVLATCLAKTTRPQCLSRALPPSRPWINISDVRYGCQLPAHPAAGNPERYVASANPAGAAQGSGTGGGVSRPGTPGRPAVPEGGRQQSRCGLRPKTYSEGSGTGGGTQPGFGDSGPVVRRKGSAWGQEGRLQFFRL